MHTNYGLKYTFFFVKNIHVYVFTCIYVYDVEFVKREAFSQRKGVLLSLHVLKVSLNALVIFNNSPHQPSPLSHVISCNTFEIICNSFSVCLIIVVADLCHFLISFCRREKKIIFLFSPRNNKITTKLREITK